MQQGTAFFCFCLSYIFQNYSIQVSPQVSLLFECLVFVDAELETTQRSNLVNVVSVAHLTNLEKVSSDYGLGP
jgi:hypothetical protein